MAQALLALLPAASGLVGEGTMAILGLGSSVATLAGGMYQASYQRAVAKSTAAIMDDNARRAIFAGQVKAQDADQAAAVEIAAQDQQWAHSGFAMTSGSPLAMSRRNRVLARRDAERIRNASELEAYDYKAQAAQARAEAKNIGAQSFFDTVGGVFDTGASLIEGASLISKRKALRLNQTNINTAARM